MFVIAVLILAMQAKPVINVDSSLNVPALPLIKETAVIEQFLERLVHVEILSFEDSSGLIQLDDQAFETLELEEVKCINHPRIHVGDVFITHEFDELLISQSTLDNELLKLVSHDIELILLFSEFEKLENEV
jgi:hypothetical protein